MADISGTLENLEAGLVELIPHVCALVASVFALVWPDTGIDYYEQVKQQV